VSPEQRSQSNCRRRSPEAAAGIDREPIDHTSAATIVACGSLNHM